MGCRERKIHIGRGEHSLCLMSLIIMVSRLAISLWREGGRRWVMNFHVSSWPTENLQFKYYYHYLLYCWMITLTKHEGLHESAT